MEGQRIVIIPGMIKPMMMQPDKGAFVAASSVTTLIGSPHSITLPSGIQAGDIIVIHHSHIQNVTVTTPSGYTLAGSYTSFAPYTKCYRRTATGGESGATVTFNLSGNAGGSALVLVVRGASSVSIGSFNRAATASVTAPGFTAAKGFLVAMYTCESVSGLSISTPPSGLPEILLGSLTTGSRTFSGAYGLPGVDGTSSNASLLLSTARNNVGYQLRFVDA